MYKKSLQLYWNKAAVIVERELRVGPQADEEDVRDDEADLGEENAEAVRGERAPVEVAEGGEPRILHTIRGAGYVLRSA